jgi:hypothetical protein
MPIQNLLQLPEAQASLDSENSSPISKERGRRLRLLSGNNDRQRNFKNSERNLSGNTRSSFISNISRNNEEDSQYSPQQSQTNFNMINVSSINVDIY